MHPNSQARRIGEKIFSDEDQRLFASVSLDRNPMHMDPVAARRLITGRQVVHGIHILLTAIEYWKNEDYSCPVSLSCSFDNPVNVGDKVIFTQNDREENHITIEATVNSVVCSQLIITLAPRNNESRLGSAATSEEAPKEICNVDKLSSSLDEAAEFHLHKSYAVKLNDADFSINFPQSYRYFGKGGFAGISALSYFVGMICPGLHSIFSSLRLDLNADSADPDLLTFFVRKYDHRARLFDISFQGCIQGSIKAFLRPPPQAQLSLRDLSAHVAAEEFRGTRSLVIGGSRGLGELTAKILAAGAGDVAITYALGFDDARKIADEINARGISTCETLKFDLITDSFGSMDIDCSALDAVYFFPTPRISRKKIDIFESQLFQEFLQFYVNKFYELCVHLEASAVAKKIKVYFPSTVFVSQRPKGMTEYPMAKAAAEVLIEEINRTFDKVSVLSTRLPRLNTDQTSSILRISGESNVEALLPIIRSLNANSTA